MFGICFEHEKLGWMQDQWSWVFSNFGVTEIWEINQGGSDFEIYQTVIGIKSYDELPENRPLVALTPKLGRYLHGEEALNAFVHPEAPIYIFGGSFSNLAFDSRQPDSCVYIPTVEYECFSHAAAYMTLWDRYVKRGGFG